MKNVFILVLLVHIFAGCKKEAGHFRNYSAIELVDRNGKVYQANVNTGSRAAVIDSLPELFEIVKVRYAENNSPNFSEEPAINFLGRGTPSGKAVDIALPGNFTLKVEHSKRASVGYIYLSDNVYENRFSLINWTGVTHAIAGFIRTSANGVININETPPVRLAQFVKTAHENGVKAIIGLGSDSENGFVNAISSINTRQTLINNLLTFTNTYGFDGIDIDFEVFDLLGSPNLIDFYRELKAAKPDRLTLSAAVSNWGNYSENYNGIFDFINLMAYDLNEGLMKPVATIEQCVDFVNRWKNVYKLPSYRLMLGIPFYGYSFDSHKIYWEAPYGLTNQIRYYDILKAYPGQDAWNKDRIDNTFYNGIPTVVEKSRYVMNNAVGGVMLWNLLMDSEDDNYSLLKNIHDVLKNY